MTIGGGVFCAEKRGVANHRPFNKTSFLNFFYARCRPPHPRLAPYTPPVETTAPSAPGTPAHITGSGTSRARCNADHATHRHTRPDALHAAPVCTRYQTGRRRPDRPGGGAGVRGVSETVQKRTRQNLKNKYAKKRKYLLTFTQESV